MNHRLQQQEIEVQTTNSEVTLEQLDLRNRRYHHLHDEVIAFNVSRLMRRFFLTDRDEQWS